MMHRWIMGVTDPEIEVDHRDNDGLNNQRYNLRPCTHLQNMRFRQPERDWEAHDAARALAEEYRRERVHADTIAARFQLTRQALWFIRRGKTTRSPAALAYKSACIDCRTLERLMADNPVQGKKFGAVRVDLVAKKPQSVVNEPHSEA